MHLTQRRGSTSGRLGRRLTSLITAGLLAAATMGTATATAATASTPDESEVSKAAGFLEENMARFEVPQELRSSLLEKALSGTTLDADLPGAVPVVVETVTNDYGTFPINRYADGSFESVGVSEEVVNSDGDVSLRAIKNCSSSGGSGGVTYTGCQVYHWTLWHNMWFHANYSRASNASTISYMPAAQRGFESANSCSTEVFGITQRTGNNASPAKADWLMTCTDFSGASSSKSLGLRVTGSSAYSVQNY